MAAPRKPFSKRKKTHARKTRKLPLWVKRRMNFDKWVVIRALIALGLWSALALGCLLLFWLHDLPTVEGLEQLPQGSRKITILAADSSVLSVHGDLRLPPLEYGQIPPHLISAVVATEDRRFFEHGGIDYHGILRAAAVNLLAGRVKQGGSSITQQLAKIAFLTSERSFKRKVQELVLAFSIEHTYSKEQIMAMYLNRAYMGAGIYGVGAAAHYYFDKNVRDLTLYQAAIIAGLLKAPSKYSPIINLEQGIKRAKQILLNMEEFGLMTALERKRAEDEPLVLNTKNFGQRRTLYFSDYVIEQVDQLVGDDVSNLVVYTSCNQDLQEKLQAELQQFIKANGHEFHVQQGAIVVMTPTGELRAMIGGTDYGRYPYNRAAKAIRQPGSAFKPIVYAAALEAGISPDAIYQDEPFKVGKWQPRNMSRGYRGAVTVAEALKLSLNTVTVRLSEEIGRTKVVDLAQKMGITTPIEPHPSIALGAIEVRVLDLTSAYAVFANNGQAVKPHAILKISQENGGKVLYQRPANLQSNRIISSDTTHKMTKILESVLTEGTGKAAYFGRPAAGKTGTSQEFRDAWFLGFTPQLVAGVWLGNDDDLPMHRVSGGTLPAKLWRQVMLTAHDNLPVEDFYQHRNSLLHAPEPEDTKPSEGGFFKNLFGLFY